MMSTVAQFSNLQPTLKGTFLTAEVRRLKMYSFVARGLVGNRCKFDGGPFFIFVVVANRLGCRNMRLFCSSHPALILGTHQQALVAVS